MTKRLCCKDREFMMDFYIETILTRILMAALLMGKYRGFSQTVFSSSAYAQDEVECITPNYLEYGQPGVIECSFQTPLYLVYWFNSTEYNDASHMIIYYSNSQTQGVGFHSGEFDLSPTGSLIIKNVTFQHDHVFTVVTFNTNWYDTIPIFVNVVVIVKPLQKFPNIDTCGNNRFCLRDAGEMKMLSCYVNNSWPAINLNFWTYNRHHQNWTEVFSSKSTVGENRQTSIIRIGLGMPTDILIVYVCAADEPPVVMNESESTVVIKRPISPSEVEPMHILVERGFDVELPCSTRQNLFVFWMKQSDNVTLDIAHRVIGRGYTDTATSERYLLTNDSNLVIRDVSIYDEGIYVCVAGGGGYSENITTFNIIVTETTIDCCEKATSEHFISAAIAAVVSIVVSCFSFGFSSLVHTRVRRIKQKKESEYNQSDCKRYDERMTTKRTVTNANK